MLQHEDDQEAEDQGSLVGEGGDVEDPLLNSLEAGGFLSLSLLRLVLKCTVAGFDDRGFVDVDGARVGLADLAQMVILSNLDFGLLRQFEGGLLLECKNDGQY